MAVQLTIPYETLVELVEQLPPAQQRALIERVQHKTEAPASLSEQLLIFEVGEWDPAWTLRREDEYDDDSG